MEPSVRSSNKKKVNQPVIVTTNVCMPFGFHFRIIFFINYRNSLLKYQNEHDENVRRQKKININDQDLQVDLICAVLYPYTYY